MTVRSVFGTAWVVGSLVVLLGAAGCRPAGSSAEKPGAPRPASSSVQKFTPLTWHQTLEPELGAPGREELLAQYGGEKAGEVQVVKGAPGQFPGEVWFALSQRPVISSDDITEVHAVQTEFGPQVEFTLTPAAGERFRQFTRDHVGACIAIVLDHQVISNPRVNGEIGERGSITGRFTAQEVDDLVKRLKR